jgi:MFS family permease
VPILFVLAGLTAGFGAIQNVVRSAIVPNLVDPEMLPQALAVNFGLYQVALVIGPGLGGLLIGGLGLAPVYAFDAISCAAVVHAAVRIAPQPPEHLEANVGVGVRRSILDGLVFVRGNRALLGSFAIDLMAMTFGMPRALFPVLAISVYHAGAEGTGLLFAAVSAGATVAALSTGWIEHTRRLGLVCIGAVLVWGAAIAGAGVMPTIVSAAVLLALAGAADSISAVCRSVINQTVTPDAMRGRMSSVFSLVVTSGPRLGDIESGTVAALTSARFSMLSGGLACLAGVGLIVLAFPQLAAFDTRTARERAAV